MSQRIVLNISTDASPSAKRIDMTAADGVAVKIASLKHVASPRTFVMKPGGGIEAKCRLTSKPMVTKGSPTALQVEIVAGKPALAVNTASAGLVGLAFPAGSLTESYTIIYMVNVGAEAQSLPDASNLLSGFDAANVWLSNPLRYNGARATPADVFSSRGGDRASPKTPTVPRVAGDWNLIVVDWNNTTRNVSIGVNSSTAISSAIRSDGRIPASTDYLEIGYHLTASGLHGSKVGDVFTFSSSLLSTPLGVQQAAALVAALKTEYGIA